MQKKAWGQQAASELIVILHLDILEERPRLQPVQGDGLWQ